MSRSFCRLKKPVGHGDTKSKCLSNLLRLLDLQTLPIALPMVSPL